MKHLALAGALLLIGPARAWADGYCEHVEHAAASEASLLYSPEVFGTFGFGEQPPSDVAGTNDGVRLTAGLRLSLGDIVEGNTTKKKAHAECKRHLALDKVEGASSARALAAKAKVLDDALDKAEQMLDDANADLKARRATAQDVDATRVRVDEVRDADADVHTQLDALPAVDANQSLSGALSDYYKADADVEKQDGKLREAKAWDINVRLGYDQFLGRANDPPFFVVVGLSVDLGWLAQGSHNRKAAEGRAREVREEHGTGEIDETATRLQAMLDVESKREDETQILLEDLEKQLKTLKSVGGSDSERYYETVWFDMIKVKAEHAYLAEHVKTLEEILGK